MVTNLFDNVQIDALKAFSQEVDNSRIDDHRFDVQSRNFKISRTVSSYFFLIVYFIYLFLKISVRCQSSVTSLGLVIRLHLTDITVFICFYLLV
jgi:hypothetical protein